MPESKSILDTIIEEGIREKIKKERKAFLDDLRQFVDRLFEEDLEPKVVQQRLLDRIDDARSSCRAESRYY